MISTTAKRAGPKGIAYWVYQSKVIVSTRHSGNRLSSVRIEFQGEIARIPSLKNSKIPGKNFINPDTLHRLKAMDALFWRAYSSEKRLTFGSDQVVGLLVCSKRATRFDLDNCAASVKDWLEPATKRARGWGVGLIDDDSQLTIFPVHAHQVGKNPSASTLILMRWEDVGDSFRCWATDTFF